MRYGAVYKYQKDGNKIKSTVQKYHEYSETVDETVYEERVQILKVTDVADILEQMLIDHALKDVGVYLEHGKSGKMYAVKTWVERSKSA